MSASWQDPFIVPSPNSFHRAARIKPVVKKAVWQTTSPLTRSPTSSTIRTPTSIPTSTHTSSSTSPSARAKKTVSPTAGRPALVTPSRGSKAGLHTPEQIRALPLQLPTPSTDGRATKVTGPAPAPVAKRAFSITRFTDPLPSPVRSPLCRLSVLETFPPVKRMEFKEAVKVSTVEAEVEVEGEREKESVEVKAAVRKVTASRIPVWKGLKRSNGGVRCPTCGATRPEIKSLDASLDDKVQIEIDQATEIDQPESVLSSTQVVIPQPHSEDDAAADFLAELQAEFQAYDLDPVDTVPARPPALPVLEPEQPVVATPDDSDPCADSSNPSTPIDEASSHIKETPLLPVELIATAGPLTLAYTPTVRPHPSASRSHSEDTLTRTTVFVVNRPRTPTSVPKPTPSKSRSFFQRWYTKTPKDSPPAPATPTQDDIAYTQGAVLDEVRRFHAEGRKLRKTVNDELVDVLDPVLDALSVTPEAEEALEEASVLDILFNNDLSFSSEKGEEKSVDIAAAEAIIPLPAIVEDSKPTLAFLKELKAFHRDGRALKPVHPVPGPYMPSAAEVEHPVPSVEKPSSPHYDASVDVADHPARAFGTDLTNRAIPESSLSGRERASFDSKVKPEFMKDTAGPASPRPAFTGIQARIFALTRHSSSGPAPFMPSAHIRRLCAPAWSDRDYVDQRTQREIEALRVIKRVDKGGENIVTKKMFDRKWDENGAVEGGEKKGMSLSALGVLMRYKKKTDA
ncbi:hypothetical protein EUX98_g3881 [Antrodiella citrinella]|uniref:Uncharacterized protein n=1 Tax=Antrodiella citrinella TaxID=2447956 RepID=A0A4S4MY81_9APHY|nr:hypothetical protein EUX98_g3881 [Antrodiella citrinella]